MNYFTPFAAAAIALAGLAAPVLAEEEGPFDAEIGARQGLMILNAMNLGILGGMAKGEKPYDAAEAQAAADALVGVFKLDTSMLWPAGSDNAATPKTNALPAIWADGSDIGAKTEAWGKAATDLQAAAGKDLDSLKAAMAPMGAACGACHKAFRASKE